MMYSSNTRHSSTPTYGNLFKKIDQVTKEGHPVTKTIEASDIILSEFEGDTEKMDEIMIRAMEIRTKELD
jgi:IS1 family transposase